MESLAWKFIEHPLPWEEMTKNDDLKGIEDSENFRQLLSQLVFEFCIIADTQVNVYLRTQEKKDFMEDLNQLRHQVVQHEGFPLDLKSPIDHSMIRILLEFISSSILAARLLAIEQIRASSSEMSDESKPVSTTDSTIKEMCSVMHGVAVSENHVISLKNLNTKISQQLTILPNQIQPPILDRAKFTDKKMQTLENINKDFTAEYSQRRELLLKRCDVTLQSFLWSSKAKEKETELKAIIEEKLKSWKTNHVDTYAAFCQNPDILTFFDKKTSQQASAHDPSAPLKKMVIGKVADRGGRVMERLNFGAQKRGVNMPSFTAKQAHDKQEIHEPRQQKQKTTAEPRPFNKNAGRGKRGGKN